jgi:hypothetical protein
MVAQRSILPYPTTAPSLTTFSVLALTLYQGEWGEITIPHFHPNTHECYGTNTEAAEV